MLESLGYKTGIAVELRTSDPALGEEDFLTSFPTDKMGILRYVMPKFSFRSGRGIIVGT